MMERFQIRFPSNVIGVIIFACVLGSVGIKVQGWKIHKSDICQDARSARIAMPYLMLIPIEIVFLLVAAIIIFTS